MALFWCQLVWDLWDRVHVNPVHGGMLHIAPPMELYKSNHFYILQRLEVKNASRVVTWTLWYPVTSCHLWRCEFRSGICRAMLGWALTLTCTNVGLKQEVYEHVIRSGDHPRSHVLVCVHVFVVWVGCASWFRSALCVCRSFLRWRDMLFWTC